MDSQDNDLIVIDLREEECASVQLQASASTSQPSTSNIQPSTSNSQPSNIRGTIFSVFQIIENLYLLGVCSLDKREYLTEHLKQNYEVLSNPLLIQISFVLNKLSITFRQSIYDSYDNLN